MIQVPLLTSNVFARISVNASVTPDALNIHPISRALVAALPLVCLLVFALLAGCSSGVDENRDYVPGKIMAKLVNSEAEAVAEKRIAELGLEWKEYFRHVGIVLIGVPEGHEQFWVEHLPEEPLIRSAQLVRFVQLR